MDAAVMDRAATEQALAAIWAEVLRRDTVGRDDDFFALGGNSLLAVRMIGLVHERMGCDVPIQRLLQSRTVAELALALAEPREPGAAQEEGVI
jgi:acyl carrier protein